MILDNLEIISREAGTIPVSQTCARAIRNVSFEIIDDPLFPKQLQTDFRRLAQGPIEQYGHLTMRQIRTLSSQILSILKKNGVCNSDGWPIK